MKYTYLGILCIALFIIVTVLMGTGCDYSISSPTISPPRSLSGLLSNARMAISVDKTTLKPIKYTDVFKKDAQTIYCSVLLVNAPENTYISSYMLIIKDKEDKGNVKRQGSSTESDGTRFLAFAWIPPATGWTSGDYKVIISVNGKEDITVPFKIE